MLAAGLTAAFGVVVLLRPRAVARAVGLDLPAPRGVTEARVSLGAIWVGLGGYVLLNPVPPASHVLCAGYAAMALVRLGAMAWDRSVDRSNLATLAVEVVLVLMLA